MFERKGYVKVAILKDQEYAQTLEKLAETALSASAEDFEELPSNTDHIEIEVS